MDDLIAQFTSITGATPERAQQYLTLSENNIEQAIQLFFETGGVDMGASMPEQPAARPAATSQRYREDQDGTITIDSDDEEMGGTDPATAQQSSAYEDDEAMARRLQEEAYGSGGPGGEFDEVRAPMARTTETLVGPDADWGGPDDMRVAVAEQMAARQRRAAGRPGIFNQQHVSVWDEGDASSHRASLARATGGASEASSKSNLLAELFRPPTDLISPLSWDDAREEGKEDEKWILVNIQDPSIFDCQVLNRDIWKNASVKETIKENFIFMQYNKDDHRGDQYVNYYFQQKDIEDAYPHIAIVDPRTGEQVKVWSGSPVPKASDFLMDLHEFLDRYSLKAFAKNPVANRKPTEKAKDVHKMTEEEMLEMALQQSLSNGGGPSHKQDDPDELTKASKGKEPIESIDEGIRVNGKSEEELSPFERIPADRSHDEPTDPASTTRIQFRWSGGRVVRRFALTDTVQRLYEWLKATPLEGKEDVEFELISMGKNLIDSLDQTVEQAGLKNGTIMIEHLES
ncbi:Thioredoxin-like protein 7 [Elsinoe fawcettii]|nr:Thioredoxin-like protein 7 [Elsinoe fawcettii]